METTNLCPPSPLLPDAAAPEPAKALPWIVEAEGRRGHGKVARYFAATPFSILDRCVIALTIVTAASLAWHGHAQASHPRELLPVVITTSVP